MAPVPAVTILHLSDLHFGRKHRFEQDGFGSLLTRVELDLKERAAKDGLRPDVVVLSGDFAEYGKREEFDKAATFVRGLKAYLGLPARRFVMVPGNHDVNWNKSRAYFEDRAGDGLLAEEPYFSKFAHYKRFFDAFYEGEDGIRFTEEEPWSLFEMPDLGVVVAAMDSAFAESHRDEDHHGFLGEKQIRAFAGRLRAFKERGYLRIGVLHHDPFEKRGGAKAEQDQRDFRRWLVPELNLVLHGDIHEETFRHLDRDVPALGVGSAAVSVEDRGPDVSNEYQLLVVSADGAERHLRAWVSDQKRWVASPRADASGESGRSVVRADFQAVTALGKREAPPPVVDLATIVERYRSTVTRCEGAPTVFDLLGMGENEGNGGVDFLRLFVPQNASRECWGVTNEGAPNGRLLPRTGDWESAGDARAEAKETFLEDAVSHVDGLSDAGSGAAGFGGAGPTVMAWIPERARTVDELFERRRLLFIGAPGAGKSALTRWLSLKLCVPGERVAGLPEGIVPVRVELRTFDQAHQMAGQGYTVFDHVARSQADFHGPLAAEHLRALSASGRVLWLFDGLDEIAEPGRRREMAERIAGLLDQYRECRAVVTSRVAGVDVARPILEGAMFQTYLLQEFSTKQRDQFLDAWHDLVFRRDPPTGLQRRQRMAAAIEEAPSLQELCKNPLLCSMLAYLHREEALPRRRHLLYQKVLERMAEHWDANKGLPARPPAERFELEDKLAFLRGLAWHMQSEQLMAGNAIARGELEDFATAFCESRWGQPRDVARRRAGALIEQLYARDGVLAYLGGDAYGFAHKAFLEHLAAAEALAKLRAATWDESALREVFAAHWRDPGWEETLLLLCGQLQDDGREGCARVVRMLQGIARGNAAEVFSNLTDHLAFYIKVLGELPQLEKDAVGEFAKAINDTLLMEMRRYPLLSSTLVGSFRRCAGRWPDVTRLVEASAAIARECGNPWISSDTDQLWIAAGGRALRCRLLSDALRREGGPEHQACKEAARHGPWTNEEVRELVAASRTTSEETRLSLVTAVVETANSRWREDDPIIQELASMAHHAASFFVRLQSASLLLRSHLHMDAARQTLLESSRRGGPDGEIATLALARQGYGEMVLGPIEKLAQKVGMFLPQLAILAEANHDAVLALKRVLVAVRMTNDPDVLLDGAAWTWAAGYRLFSDEEILERWKTLPNSDYKEGRIGWFRFIAGAEELLVRAWLMLLNEEPRYARRILWQSLRMDPQAAGPRLSELWTYLLDLGNTEIAIQLAGHLLRTNVEGSLRARAIEVRDQTLLSTAPEEVRFRAAQDFRAVCSRGQEVLLDLANHAQSEFVRFWSACLSGDLASLNKLMGETKDNQLRHKTRQALDLYGEINTLLQVGKLRRARVRLDGRDAGVLEELTKVGNGTRFRYDDGYDGPPIAPNMPLGPTYENTESLLPFFANLLPEGALYEQTARRLGVKRADRLGVLLRVGGDTMGAVEVFPMESA